MGWIEEEFERRRKQKAATRASVADETNRRESFMKILPMAWKRLVDAIVADLEKFNSVSDRKATPKVGESQLEVHYGKAGPLLLIKLDPEKYYVTCSRPNEPLRKIKILLREGGEPYLWDESHGDLSFERASEVLLKPVLFP